MPSKKEEPISIDEMVKFLSEGVKNSQWTNNIHTYNAHPDNYNDKTNEKQVEFHQSQARGRMFLGGNRSGKTVAGAVESIWWLTRKHPYYRVPEWKIEGRCGSVDFINGVDKITLPEVKKWLPPSELIKGSWEESFSNQYRTLTLANGNTLEFLSYDQDLDKWAGTARDFIWFDEEPPETIFTEGLIRLTSKDGRYWLTMTPVEGATWTLTELYEKSQNRGDAEKDIYVVEVEVEDNKSLNMDVVRSIFGELSEEEQQIRRRGKYVHDSSLIFTNFDRETNIISKLPFNPRQYPYRIVASVDIGLYAPTAWLWHALTPDGKIYTFHEMSKAEWTIPQFAQYVKRWEYENGITPIYRVGDPAAKQRSRQTGLSDQLAYAQQGVNFKLGTNEVNASLDRMNDYLRTGHWIITENCVTLIKQMRKYRWEPWANKKMKAKNNPKDKPMKKDDHSIDSTRYLFSTIPDLRAREYSDRTARIEDANRNAQSTLGAVRGMYEGNMRDTFVQPSAPVDWSYDDLMGEY